MHHPPQYTQPSCYPAPEEYEGPRRRRMRRRNPEELEDYLQDLEDEIGRVRRELVGQRERGQSAGQEQG